MKDLKKKKIIQIFSDGSTNFNYSIIKRSKKTAFYTKDHVNFFLNQRILNRNSLHLNENFKTKYI